MNTGVQGLWPPDFWDAVRAISNHGSVYSIGDLTTADTKIRSSIKVLITTSTQAVNMETLIGYTGLQYHLRAASGDENVDVAYLTERNIQHIRFPEPYASSAAEHAVLLLLACLGRILMHNEKMISGIWDRPSDAFCEVKDLQVTIVGFGHVGTRVYELLQVWGANLSICDPFLLMKSENFEALLPRADAIIFCARAGSAASRASFPIFRMQHLPLLKRGVCIINISRGSVMDEDALRKGLEQGIIGMCGLDVFWREPLPPHHWLYQMHDRVILTPHIGSRTAAAQKRMTDALLNVLRRIGDSVEMSDANGTHSRPSVGR